jgi:hypothetical protein
VAFDFLDDEDFARRVLQPSLLVSCCDAEPAGDRTQFFAIFDGMEDLEFSCDCATHGLPQSVSYGLDGAYWPADDPS